MIQEKIQEILHSNTTLVKVKLAEEARKTAAKQFKYNTC